MFKNHKIKTTLSDIIETEDWYVIPRENGGAYLIQKTRTEPDWTAIDASGGKIVCSFHPLGLAYQIIWESACNQYIKATGWGSADPGYDIKPISDNVVEYDKLAEEDYLLARMNGTLLESPFVIEKIKERRSRGRVRGNFELVHPWRYKILRIGKKVTAFALCVGLIVGVGFYLLPTIGVFAAAFINSIIAGTAIPLICLSEEEI